MPKENNSNKVKFRKNPIKSKNTVLLKWIKIETILCTLLFVFSGGFVFFGYYYSIFSNVQKSIQTKLQTTETNGYSEEGCAFVDIVGDDICDDQANIKACAYDFGDCCSFDNDRSLCLDCICIIDFEAKMSYLEKSCRNEPSDIEAYSANYIIKFILGDGNCHLNFNSKQFDFDQGDCCLPNPECLELVNPLIGNLQGSDF